MRRVHLLASVLVLALGLLTTGCLDGTETTATADKVVGELPTAATKADDLPALKLIGEAAAGKAVFASQSCGSCHTLAASGTSGAVGPNLDESKSSTELVVARVTEGKSPMPAFGETLTAQQIADVAAYVSQSTGG
ncbi:MAG: cytochrome c [Thermoleophilia bacterium]